MCQIFDSTKFVEEKSNPDTLDRCGTSILGEDFQVKAINQMSSKKNANGRIVGGAAVAPPHEKECTKNVEGILEHLSRRDETKKMQAEKPLRVKNPIDFDLSNGCQAGRNNIKAWWRCNKAEWFAKKFRDLHSTIADELPPQLLYPKEHCSMNTYTVRDYQRVSKHALFHTYLPSFFCCFPVLNFWLIAMQCRNMLLQCFHWR